MEQHEHVHPTHTRLPGPLTLIAHAWKEYKFQFHKLLPLLSIIFLIAVLQIVLMFTASSPQGVAFYALGSFLGSILNFISYIVLITAIIHHSRVSLNLSELYTKASKIFFPTLWITILVMLTVIGGLALFIIPGIIVSILLSFAVYILIAEHDKGITALIKSWHYIKGNWWRFVWRMIVFGIFVILTLLILKLFIVLIGLGNIGPSVVSGVENNVDRLFLIPAVIDNALGSFFILPMTVIYMTSMYKALRHLKPELHTPEATRIKKLIKILSILGAVVLGLIILGIILFVVAVLNGGMQQGITDFAVQSL